MGVKVEAVSALQKALDGLPGLELASVDDRGNSTRVRARIAGRTYVVNAIWVGNGWPNEVREAIKLLGEGKGNRMVLTAKRFSKGAVQILREHEANWADQAGQARIVLPPSLVIAREAELPNSQEERPQEVAWSPSSIQIAEFILHEGLSELHTGKLADKTPWSAPQVSKVLKMFDSLGWTEQHGGKSGRATRRDLVAPGSLLDAWADHVSQEPKDKRLGHVTSRDLVRFAHTDLYRVLGRKRKDWALTTWAGLELTTPYATTVPTLHLYVAGMRFGTELREVMRNAGVREVEDGARVEFWRADFPLLTQRGEPSGIPVTSRPRLYADLLGLGGRATEAAEHYRSTALGI